MVTKLEKLERAREPEQVEMICDDLGECLRVGCRPRSQHVDVVRHASQLVRHPIVYDLSNQIVKKLGKRNRAK